MGRQSYGSSMGVVELGGRNMELDSGAEGLKQTVSEVFRARGFSDLEPEIFLTGELESFFPEKNTKHKSLLPRSDSSYCWYAIAINADCSRRYSHSSCCRKMIGVGEN